MSDVLPHDLGLEQELEHLHQLLEGYDADRKELLRRAIASLLRIAKTPCDMADLRLIDITLRELRKTFQVFLPYRDIRKICMFGSARTKSDDPDYQLAEEFAEKITQKGFMIITGAGGGIMEAGNKGSEVNMSFGVNIDLPFEQSANPYIATSSKLVSYKYFFTRKLTFIKETDATILFPGGYGTHDEGFEVLTLLQNGRCAPRPVVLFSHPGSQYWHRWQDFIQKDLLTPGYISGDDIRLFTHFSDVDKAVEYILNFYKIYHSIRYFDNTAVIRLNRPLPDALIPRLTKDFRDIIPKGEFQQRHPSELTMDTEEYPTKMRLIFNFNKMSYGRLIDLIEVINKS